MVDTGASRVEEHGPRRNQLGQENDYDRLPPIQPNTNHGTSKSPVAHTEAQVEGNEIPPAPSTLLGRGRIEIFIAPGGFTTWMSMSIEGRILGLNGIFEGCWRGEGDLHIMRLDRRAFSEGGHFRELFQCRGEARGAGEFERSLAKS